MLTNINNLRPYVKDENVIHIGQRDREETCKYGSQDIKKTTIKCFDIADINKKGMNLITDEALHYINSLKVEGF